MDQEKNEMISQPTPKKSFLSLFKSNKIIFVAIAMVAVIVASAVIISASNKPIATIEKAFANSVKSIEKSETYQTVEDVLDGGSVEINLDLNELSEMFGEDLDAQVNCKFFSNLDQTNFAMSCNATVDGTKAIDLIAAANEKYIAVSSDSLLNGAYGISLETIDDDYFASEFCEGGAYELGISDEQAEILFDMIDQLMDFQKSSKEDQKTLRKVVQELLSDVQKYAEIEKGSGEVSVAGKDVKTNDITITIDEEALEKILSDFVDFLKKDKSVRKLVDRYSDRIGALYDNMDELLFVAGAPSAVLGASEDFSENFYDALDELSDVIPDISDEVEDLEIEFTTHIKSSKLIGADIKVSVEGEKVIAVSLVVGMNWGDPDEISVKIEEMGTKVSFSYVVETNSGKEYSATFRVKEDSETILSGSVKWDKKSGDFRVKGEMEDETEFSFKANVLKSRNNVTIDLIEVAVDGEEQSLKGIQIVLNEKDKMPDINKYENFLKLSEDEIDALIEDVREAASEIGDLLDY